MTVGKVSVTTLGGVSETLLIPLVARASADILNPDLGYDDPTARHIMGLIDVDPARFTRDQATMRGCVIRARWFDRIARTFFQRHPGGLCVSMGSGLDTRAGRVGLSAEGEGTWIDFDFPEVVALRQMLIPQQPGVEARAADLTQTGWIEALPWPEGRPVLFLSEGVMIYFQQAEAEALIRRLGAAAETRQAPMELGFDYVSPLMKAHSHHATAVGKTKARYAWALKRPADVLHLDHKLSIREDADIGRDSGTLGRLASVVYGSLTGGLYVYAAAHLIRAH